MVSSPAGGVSELRGEREKVKLEEAVMNNREFREKLDACLSPLNPVENREERFAQILKQGYEEDLNLLCTCVTVRPGVVRQVCVESPEGRYVICHTTRRSWSADPGMVEGCRELRCRDVLGNLMNKDNLVGLIVNPDEPAKTLKVSKEILKSVFSAPVEKPEGFADDRLFPERSEQERDRESRAFWAELDKAMTGRPEGGNRSEENGAFLDAFCRVLRIGYERDLLLPVMLTGKGASEILVIGRNGQEAAACFTSESRVSEASDLPGTPGYLPCRAIVLNAVYGKLEGTLFNPRSNAGDGEGLFVPGSVLRRVMEPAQERETPPASRPGPARRGISMKKPKRSKKSKRK